MTDTPPVDAGGTEPAPQAAPNDNQADYWKNEAHNAFEKRNAAKAEVKDLKAQIAELSKPPADAGDTAQQLAAMIADRDALQTKLDQTTQAHRESAILNKLTAGLPADRHEAIGSLYRAHAATLDDGEADAAEIAEKAGGLLSKIAAPLFETQAARPPGRLPNEGRAPEFSPEKARAEHAAELRKMGATGFSL